MLIAIDHGNYAVKTPHFSFISGLTEHTVKPPMLYREKNYLRVQELSMDLLSIDMYESEVHYYLIKAMLMSGSKTLSQIYFRQAEPYLTDEHMQEVKTLFTSCRT